MRVTHQRCAARVAALALLLLLHTIPAANADPITIPGYTVTDLGAGTPTFSTTSSGNGILSAPSGQTFAFEQTPNTTLTLRQGIMANFPQLQPVPGYTGYGPPNPTTFSYVTSATMNANGVVLAINVEGTFGHEYMASAFAVQHNPDGTWGQPQWAYAGGGQFDMGNIGSGMHAMLSNSNQILIADTTIPNDNINVFLYNMNTRSLTNLSSLLLATRYLQFQPIAIDDLGRIVLSAQLNDGTGAPTPTNLLLTPDNLSSSPLEAPVPEPGTLAVMLLAIAGFAARANARIRR